MVDISLKRYNKPPSTMLVGPDRGVVETAERRPKKGGEREGYCQIQG